MPIKLSLEDIIVSSFITGKNVGPNNTVTRQVSPNITEPINITINNTTVAWATGGAATADTGVCGDSCGILTVCADTGPGDVLGCPYSCGGCPTYIEEPSTVWIDGGGDEAYPGPGQIFYC